MRLANLDLGPAETALLGLQRLLYELGVLDVDPSAFGVVALDRIPGAPREAVERQVCFAAAQVPKRRIDGGQSDRRQRPNRRRVNVKEKVAPNPLEIVSVAAEQEGYQVIVEKLND